jgi:hypothetical protein
LAHALRGTRYQGMWFDPRTGATHLAESAGDEFRKPSKDAWLLLLTASE